MSPFFKFLLSLFGHPFHDEEAKAALFVGEASLGPPSCIGVSARRPGPRYRFGDLRAICQRSTGRVAAYQIYIEHRSHRVFTGGPGEPTCTRARASGSIRSIDAEVSVRYASPDLNNCPCTIQQRYSVTHATKSVAPFPRIDLWLPCTMK